MIEAIRIRFCHEENPARTAAGSVIFVAAGGAGAKNPGFRPGAPG